MARKASEIYSSFFFPFENKKMPLLNSNKEKSIHEVKSYFCSLVKQELNNLVEQGVPHEVAVKSLLSRIVQNIQHPNEDDVVQVMSLHSMNRDDAVRALIVKHELARLKLLGLDVIEAVNELTDKIKLPSGGHTARNVPKEVPAISSKKRHFASDKKRSRDGYNGRIHICKKPKL